MKHEDVLYMTAVPVALRESGELSPLFCCRIGHYEANMLCRVAELGRCHAVPGLRADRGFPLCELTIAARELVRSEEVVVKREIADTRRLSTARCFYSVCSMCESRTNETWTRFLRLRLSSIGG